ncbi:adenylate/guanylate cyclase domain-containing protein [Bradyrhizobium sp. sGM-13]|uniref:adenylate/guanylate cyclase domain-containing protein n=1 Tax=Bradyrhizobium sp. sGM-13 TaxID=2831781 RepID=UPI001BD11053|nr:adenylate/guanylate cyclase domain-containing protein [Bradyrhizobium sp. sGM-13]
MLGERKQVTVLFADIRGSTALIDRLDPEEALEILGPVLQLLMDAIHQHDGFVNQVRGDGVMALFGAPIASEDHAVQACRAALAMQARIDQQNRKGAHDIALRVGMNSGEVVIHSIGNDLAMNYDAVGKTVHLAARMEELATPGTILLTAATHRLAKGFISAVSRGSVAAKGIAEFVETFELKAMLATTRWLARSSQGRQSVLVGRQAELRSLRNTLESVADRNGQALTAVGAAGLGKSRLIHDFIRDLPDRWTVFEAACAPQRTRSSYYPISNLIRAVFGIAHDDGPETAARRVGEEIGLLDPNLSAFLPCFFALLDLSTDDQEWKNLEPYEKRRETIEAVKALILSRERRAPLVILIEDVHWMDAETKLILHNLVSSLRGARIFLIVTQRPEGCWTDRGLIRLDLLPLDETASDELLDRLMGADVTLLSLKKRIQARAQGNPLFLEELVQGLAETGNLEGQPGKYRLSKPAGPVEIPQTIHSVLAARIDLLDASLKTLIQTSAVIGPDISIALLSGMLGVPSTELADDLRTLEAADLLRKVRDVAPEYSFKHDLTREVAYGTMLLGLRRSLHAKAVETIESRFADRIDEHIDRLAEHAFLAELWEKAVPYQLRSCRRAVRRGANQDAIGIFQRGLETLSHWPASPAKTKAEIDFRLTVVIALEPLGKHRRIADVMREARSLADASNDPFRTTAVNCQLALALWRLGDHGVAMTVAEEASAIARQIGDPAFIFASLFMVGIVHHETGAFEESIKIHEGCFAFESPELDSKRAGWAAYPSVVLRTFLTDSLIELGEMDRAEAMAQQAINRAREVDHFYSLANISHVLARLRTAQGRHSEALSLLQECWQTCLDLEIVQMYPIFAARMGEAYLAGGDVDAAIEILSVPERLDVPLAEHAFGWRYLFVAQGRAFLAAGRHAEAYAAAKRALALAEERGEPPQQAYALKLMGDIESLSGGPDRSEAEPHLQRAFELAEKCGMRPLATLCSAALSGRYVR